MELKLLKKKKIMTIFESDAIMILEGIDGGRILILGLISSQWFYNPEALGVYMHDCLLSQTYQIPLLVLLWIILI